MFWKHKQRQNTDDTIITFVLLKGNSVSFTYKVCLQEYYCIGEKVV